MGQKAHKSKAFSRREIQWTVSQRVLWKGWKMNKRLIVPFAASCVVFAGCGAIAEEAAERALEQTGVEVELDDVEDGNFDFTIEGEDGEQATIEVNSDEGTVQIESDNGEETVNIDAQFEEDGDFTVVAENEDGEEIAVFEGDGEEGTFDFETDEGDASLSVGSELVEGWPSEFSLPDDAIVTSSVGITDEDGTRGFNTFFEGPAGSFDSYVEHFRSVAPVVTDEEVLLEGTQVQRIEWGTEGDIVGALVLIDDGGVLGGQISLGLL